VAGAAAAGLTVSNLHMAAFDAWPSTGDRAPALQIVCLQLTGCLPKFPNTVRVSPAIY